MRITVLIFRGSDPSTRTICPPPGVARLLVRASSTAESKGLPQDISSLRSVATRMFLYMEASHKHCVSKRRTVTKNREFCQI